MGAEMDTPGSKFKWNDQFWDDTYNQMAAKFSANVPQTSTTHLEDSFDERIKIASSSDSDDSDSDKGKGGGGDSSSDVSSFDGEIVIEKSKKSLLTLPSSSKSNGKVKEKSNKEKASDKLDKSKAIKKEKKVKKKSK